MAVSGVYGNIPLNVLSGFPLQKNIFKNAFQIIT